MITAQEATETSNSVLSSKIFSRNAIEQMIKENAARGFKSVHFKGIVSESDKLSLTNDGFKFSDFILHGRTLRTKLSWD